ncbi:MAG TPA: hypothetical protein VJ180_13745 [Pyrinomonadaceae bacterium]|nr:hypothetical protein [Pyrinomonadaceae bacterium]
MSYHWFDLIGIVGVLLIMVAYALLQLDRLRSSAISFSLINALGALLIMVSLVFNFNLSAFLMEFFWFAISLFGAIRRMVSNVSPAR